MAENGMRGPGNVAADMANGHHNDNGKNIANGIDQKPPPNRMNEVAQKYYQELLAERSQMENHFPLATKLIDDALEKIKITGRIPNRDHYADVYQQKTIKLSQKVHVPIKDKKFNYVGKLLGPKGNSLRRLQEETQCKIVILGRFSMKDRNREEELRNSSDSKYAHLNLPLHVEVSTIAPPAEAYARIAYALSQIRRYLMPDKHDDIRQEQFRELMSDPEAAKKLTVRNIPTQPNSNHGGGGNGGGYSGQGGNNYRGNGPSGGFRPKYQQDQHNSNDGGSGYYRGQQNSSNYHPQKNYGPGRNNQMQGGGGGGMHGGQSGMQSNLVMSVPNNFNNRNHMGNNNASSGGGAPGGGGAYSQTNPRYRQNGPYQNKK